MKLVDKVYVLFQTDVWKSKASRVFFGVFSSEKKALKAAIKNDLYLGKVEVEIIEVELNEFEEI
jgi:hypothetical protein